MEYEMIDKISKYN